MSVSVLDAAMALRFQASQHGLDPATVRIHANGAWCLGEGDFDEDSPVVVLLH